MISMDLNASPLPEDEEEEIFGEHVEEEIAEEEHVETAVETFRRKREERRQKLKREHPNDGPRRTLQPAQIDSMTQNNKFYDKSKLPPGEVHKWFSPFWKREGESIEGRSPFPYRSWASKTPSIFCRYICYQTCKKNVLINQAPSTFPSTSCPGPLLLDFPPRQARLRRKRLH